MPAAIERRGHVGQLDARRLGQDARGPRSGVIGRSKRALMRQRVTGEHRHPHARAPTPQVGEAEDLAALVAELLLLVGLVRAVVDDRAGERDHVERDVAGNICRLGELDRATVEGELGGAVDHLADLLVELGHAGQAAAGDRLVGADHHGDAARPRGRAGRAPAWPTMVVQLGLATMPFGLSTSACGVDLGTTSGTSGSMRQAEELSMTMAPAAATRGGQRP